MYSLSGKSAHASIHTLSAFLVSGDKLSTLHTCTTYNHTSAAKLLARIPDTPQNVQQLGTLSNFWDAMPSTHQKPRQLFGQNPGKLSESFFLFTRPAHTSLSHTTLSSPPALAKHNPQHDLPRHRALVCRACPVFNCCSCVDVCTRSTDLPRGRVGGSKKIRDHAGGAMRL